MNIKSIIGVATALSLVFSVSFANDSTKAPKVKVVNSANPELQKKLGQEVVDSAGAKYLKNFLKKKQGVEKVIVNEIYTKNISEDWKGGIFDVTVEDPYGDDKNDIIKLFYNDGGLVVLDIFTTDGRSMIQQLSLPLLSTKIAYSKDFLILKRDSNKKSLKGKDMVIFSDPQCPYCMQRVPEVLNFAKKNNMNVYYYDIPLPIPEHANSKEIAMCLHTAIAKNKNKAVSVIKNTYGHDFGRIKKGLASIIIEFNRISGVAPIAKKDIKEANAKGHLEESVNTVNILHIKRTPTVYVDGKKL